MSNNKEFRLRNIVIAIGRAGAGSVGKNAVKGGTR